MDFKNLKEFMRDLTEWRIPGNSVVVYKDGKEVFSHSSGYANIEKRIRMTGNEHLNIYSCSKPVTVAAVMQLFEKGKFLLSDPLYDFIPEYKEMLVKGENGEITPATKPITIRDCLAMTSGFSYDLKCDAIKEAREITDGKMDTLTVIKCFAKEPLLFNPGERWRYSFGLDVLGGVIEVITGKKFSEYVQENIFAPLEMNDSSYHNENVRDKMAEQYMFRIEKESDIVALQAGDFSRVGGRLENVGKANTTDLGPEFDSGGGGIVSTVSDMGKFVAAMANGGIGVNGEKILSRGTIDLIRTNQLTGAPMQDFTWQHFIGYGYGLGVRTMMDRARSGSNGSVGEFGWGGAAGSTILVDPDENLAVFYAHHMLNPQEGYYQPRLRNVIYSCL